jgi:hypothetical protein
MSDEDRVFLSGGWKRAVGMTVICCILFVGTSGLSCDSEAFTIFRKNASSAVGEGIKTIFDGIVDGLVAAAEAGDGDTSE